ncbi:hypothetical protein VSWAT3_25679 [Vibrionales bacterium SWAT-3]|nr:hypothetical protein VSWAT3_25679 [Vibrionales bacterium SWAT-3]
MLIKEVFITYVFTHQVVRERPNQPAKNRTSKANKRWGVLIDSAVVEPKYLSYMPIQ